ncbi:MAG: hypothetical protein HYZ65_15910 [Burkholderiales bacterium]|nr:hypothetical protein [Burkholderiales bacterium]
MHVEVPKAKFASIREFAGEYLMIVISIATALALEHAAQTMHHNHLAHEATEIMDREIQSNITSIQDARKKNAVQLKTLMHLGEVLLADIKSKQPDAAILDHFKQEAKQDFNLLIATPSPHCEAWDVAVANQSASWLPPETLHKYSTAYSIQRRLPQMVTENIATIFSGARMIDMQSDLEAGIANPRDVFRSLNQMIGVHNITDLALETVESKLLKNFPKGAVH